MPTEKAVKTYVDNLTDFTSPVTVTSTTAKQLTVAYGVGHEFYVDAGADIELSCNAGAIKLTPFTNLLCSKPVIFDNTLSLLSGTSINEFSIDGTLAGNSDDAVSTEKAVKTYVDNLSDSEVISTTATGLWAAAQNITLTVKKVGDLVVLNWGDCTSTSNSTGWISITASISSQFRPTLSKNLSCVVNENGALTNGYITVTSDGVLSFFEVGGNFTSGVVCGLNNSCVSYSIS